MPENKKFYVQNNIGKAKYVVSHHDGIKAHPDGSRFFDIEIFTNKKACTDFVNKLTRHGYAQA